MKKVALICGILVTATLAFGGNGFSLYGIYGEPEDADDGYAGVGIKYQYEMTESLIWELRGSFLEMLGADDNDELRIIPLETDLLVAMPLEGMKLYLGGGVGYYTFDFTDALADDATDDEVGFFGVAGLEIELTDSLALFGEAKYTVVELTGSSSETRTYTDVVNVPGVGSFLATVTETTTVEIDGDLDGLGGSIGLIYKW